MSVIELASDLQLPEDAVTRAFALLAMKGAGKSNAAVVFAEELHRAGFPVVAIDPKGDWWGIRAGRDGKAEGGLPIPIFGGLHADVPIDAANGALLADLIVEQHMSALIDVSELTKGESIRFLQAFFDRLYRRKNRDTYPMHLFLEECDDYVPQKVYRDVAALVRTVELVVKRGRNRGLGITLISQRAASINKDVLTQTDTLIALRNTSPQDRKAIEAWLTWHAAAKETAQELATLADGEAWVSSPSWLQILQRVKFHQRDTFDSGATPERGARVKPATLADLDLVAINDALAEQIEKAERDDPNRLRRRIAELERQLANVKPETVERVVQVEVDAIPEWLPETLRACAADVAAAHRVIGGLHERLLAIPRSTAVTTADPVEKPVEPQASVPRKPKRVTFSENARNAASGSAQRIGKRERSVLTVLAQYPQGRSRRQLAMLTGYSPRTSTLGVALSTCRAAGWIDGDDRITDAGLAALGEWEPLPTGRALLDYWMGELGKREREILTVLLDEYPAAVLRSVIAERTGYSLQTSTLGVGLSKLRGLELIERTDGGERVSDDFMQAIA